MLSLLVRLLLVRQNPNPPNVLLPDGWRVDYRRPNRENAAYLVGPQGQSIAFSRYGGEGDRAAELRGADPQGVFAYANLDGRKVSVAIARDGRLAVSYPQAWPFVHSSFHAFDYWATVQTAREAAVDLLVALTRVEAYKGRAYGGHETSAPPTPTAPGAGDWTGTPLGWISTPLEYRLRRNAAGDGDMGALECPGKPSVEAYRPGSKGALPVLADLTAPRRWEETRTILGRVLHVAEGERGGLAAWVTQAPGLPAKGIGPVFTTQETSSRAAVVLVLARLSFDKLEG